MTDTLTVCEFWDLTQPTLPPRSRLYHLEPIGVGTPYVESLTGYVARLAEAHSIHTRTLVVHELLPLLGRAHLLKPANSSLSAFWSNGTRSVNGTRSLARDWVQTLETLTLRSDLRFLTLLTWADVLTPYGLLRPTRAWCPTCYKEWRTAGQVVYEPLIWALKVITVCPNHNQWLSTQCPYQDCQQLLPLMESRSRPGYCSRCERWLGISPDAKLTNNETNETIQDGKLKWQIWLVNVVGELLAAAPNLSSPPSRGKIATAISVYVKQVTEGNTSALARKLQVSSSAARSWQRGEQVPQLELLLRVCYCFGTSPLHLLTEDIVSVEPSIVKPPVLDKSQCKPKARRRPFDAERMQRALEAVLSGNEHPPPSMREIARRLEYSHSFLHAKFPELCREISARYLSHQKARGRRRIQKLCKEVRRAASTIHAQGTYPSAYRIESLLSVPGFMRHPEAIATWHESLKELGWES